ncbi:MAG: dienelactone hydrolase family protein [Anaerolineales bacterium]|nr:dienelactone hydrolase family protein [Anaerolineales bacterium]MCB9146238.1 dienelactone hydrolase family protein [Anaerolineales bacterium]
MAIQTSDLQLSVNDKKVYAYLANGGGPGVLVLHAWWGLKPFFKQVCNQIASQGFTVLAPDMREGQIATTIDEAKALMENSNSDFTGGVVFTAKDYLREITKGKIGVVGFSMGGAWALILASTVSEQVGAVTLFYGNEDMDVSKITAKVMGHFSDNDEWEPNEWVDKKFGQMKEAGVDYTLHIYPGVAHWFMEDDRPEYDSAAAQLAWSRTFEFLKAAL